MIFGVQVTGRERCYARAPLTESKHEVVAQAFELVCEGVAEAGASTVVDLQGVTFGGVMTSKCISAYTFGSH